MTKSVVARLRALAQPAADPLNEEHRDGSVFLTLLDIVEAVAEVEPWNDRRYCRYCGRAEWEHEALHSLDCPYRRAREMCGKGDG